MGIVVRYVALRLSHQSIGVEEIRTPISMNSEQIQWSSTTVDARALYSDSMEECDTVRYLHEP